MRMDPPTTNRPARRFTMGDGMVLVAASAASFGLVRAIDPLRTVVRYPLHVLTVAYFFAGTATWTPAVLALRLLQPRPSLQRLCRQPGFAATFAGATILGLSLATVAILALVRAIRSGQVTTLGQPALHPFPGWWTSVMIHFGWSVGPAVIVSWLMLIASGRRRPERGWLDPLGRALGVAWIALFIIHCGLRLEVTIR